MTKLDPIIAVKDVNASAKWYEEVFGFERKHGGDEFAVLTDKGDEIILCLHKWGEHEHPTLLNPELTTGNGLILYFRTENLERIRENVKALKREVEEEINVNPNSLRKEFSLRDPDGYYLTISEFHSYEG